MQVTRVVEQRIVSEERIKIKIWKLWNKESSLISESNCKYMEVVEQRIVCDASMGVVEQSENLGTIRCIPQFSLDQLTIEIEKPFLKQ